MNLTKTEIRYSFSQEYVKMSTENSCNVFAAYSQWSPHQKKKKLSEPLDNHLQRFAGHITTLKQISDVYIMTCFESAAHKRLHFNAQI